MDCLESNGAAPSWRSQRSISARQCTAPPPLPPAAAIAIAGFPDKTLGEASDFVASQRRRRSQTAFIGSLGSPKYTGVTKT